jgi:hypothetical protein
MTLSATTATKKTEQTLATNAIGHEILSGAADLQNLTTLE